MWGPLQIPSKCFVIYPQWFIESNFDWGRVDLESFLLDEWEYEPDPLWGLIDVVQRPSDSLENPTGDCTDFARFALTWLYNETDRPLSLYLCFTFRNPPGHLIVYDGERTYSTAGGIEEETPAEYKERTNRGVLIRRSVRESPGPRLV